MTHLSYRATLLAVTVAALMWGLYWVPIHWLKATGMSGTVGAFALVVGILPVILWRAVQGGLTLNRRHVAGALAIGTAISLYGAALNFTEVTRVVLLFYLSPAWSILIECKWFGRRLDRRTGLALLLFALGLIAMVNPLGSDTGFLSGLNVGDLIALVAGACWSGGAAIVFSSDAPNALDLGVVANAFAIAVAGTVAWIAPGSETLAAVNWPAAALIAVLCGCLYVLPVTVLTFVGAARLAPATVTFLLSAEVLSGVASSSVWLGEPFTLAKALGTLLIICGVMVEIRNSQQTA